MIWRRSLLISFIVLIVWKSISRREGPSVVWARSAKSAGWDCSAVSCNAVSMPCLTLDGAHEREEHMEANLYRTLNNNKKGFVSGRIMLERLLRVAVGDRY